MSVYFFLANYTEQGIRHVKDSPARLDATCADFVLRVAALGNIRTTTVKAFAEPAFREIIAALP